MIGDIETYSTERILDYVRKDFLDSGADSVQLIDNNLLAENKRFDIRIRPDLNFNRWIGISYAKLQIIESNLQRNALYSFDTTRILVIGFIAGLLFGLISQMFWIGLLVFGAIGVLNWIIKILQHWICFDSTFGDIIYDGKHKTK